uniref:Uncharacterized protein n=1 Tax=Meloidogyne javanica TaxID=6303 RepID=A0A915N0P0_MELJA
MNATSYNKETCSRGHEARRRKTAKRGTERQTQLLQDGKERGINIGGGNEQGKPIVCVVAQRNGGGAGYGNPQRLLLRDRI